MNWDAWIGSPDGRPTMWVKRLFSFLGYKLELHKIVDADDVACFHTHPARALRFVFKGGYIENHFANLSMEVVKPPFLGFVRPDTCHRIETLLKGPSYSLWLRWPKSHGICLRGSGWRPGPYSMGAVHIP